MSDTGAGTDLDRVAVVHALRSGTGRTFAALSNLGANRDKLNGQWGPDIWMILDRGIESSREGRFLPADGDTSAYESHASDAAKRERLRRLFTEVHTRPNVARQTLQVYERALAERGRSLERDDAGPWPGTRQAAFA